MKVTEYDEAPDGGWMYEVDTYGYTTYIHHTHDGRWLAYNSAFEPVRENLRTAQIDLCREYESVNIR